MLKLIGALFILLVVAVFVANRLVRAAKGGQNTAASGASKVVGASDAARRSLCLASILARTNLEFESRQATPAKSGENADGDFLKNQREFLKTNGIWDALSVRERTLLEKPPGAWSMQEIADGQWRAEALGVLLWALKQTQDLPAYDTQAPIASVMNSLPSPGSSARFVSKAALRSENEILEARTIAELWLWRARTTQVQLSGTAPPEGWTFEEIIATAAEGAQRKKLFTPIDNDFSVLNKAYAKLSEDEWQTMRSIAQERLYALNWLCKYAADWDKVPTGT